MLASSDQSVTEEVITTEEHQRGSAAATKLGAWKCQMRLFVFLFIAVFLYETIGVIAFGVPSLHTLLGK